MNYAELVRLETAIETCQNIFKKSHNGIIKASKLLFFGEIIAEYQTKLDILKRNLN